jgi:hypothetical protein
MPHYEAVLKFLPYSVRRLGRPTECPEVPCFRGVLAPQITDLGLSQATTGVFSKPAKKSLNLRDFLQRQLHYHWVGSLGDRGVGSNL